MKADKLQRHYKKHSSGFKDWNQKAHAEDYMVFPENMGEYLSIDEVALSQGELYTFLTNKAGKGKKGTLVASIKGTSSKEIIAILDKIPVQLRSSVKEVTLDMAKNMESSIRESFPQAAIVTDRFHVVKLAMDAVQHVRIKQRWKELDKENTAIQKAKEDKLPYKAIVFKNGDTPKQLLARSRYILAKRKEQWTENQLQRATILFSEYPKIKLAYDHVISFRAIYEHNTKESAKEKLLQWILESYEHECKQFNTVANSIQYHLDNILNFFNNRNTNANAESFNAKTKLFRANLRGVSDIPFFLFRLQNLFA